MLTCNRCKEPRTRHCHSSTCPWDRCQNPSCQAVYDRHKRKGYALWKDSYSNRTIFRTFVIHPSGTIIWNGIK